jgi:peptide/bleomycin uptake transporter
MFKAFFRRKRWFHKAYGGSAAILVLLVAQLEVALWINRLNKRFYDVWGDAAHHLSTDLYQALLPFIWISGLSVLITTLAVYITSKFVFWWREAVTFHYLTLARRKKPDIEGASQRIQEDVARFAKVMETIAWTIVGSVFTLIGFVPILWSLSSGVQIPILSKIPGSLVWVCFATSIGGFLISWIVGSKLPGLEYDQQTVEAAFRKELVYCEDEPDKYENTKLFQERFRDIGGNYNRLIRFNALFDIWKNTYLMFIWMVPFAVLASGLAVGLITFGIMMQVNDAFTRLNNTIAQFIQNWQIITEVRSIYRRLGEFEQQLTDPSPKQKEETPEVETEAKEPEVINDKQ